jgi:hypothetical protein
MKSGGREVSETLADRIEKRIRDILIGSRLSPSDIRYLALEAADEATGGQMKVCRHTFEKLLHVRGSLMCPECHHEIARYGDPIDLALTWWREEERKRKRDE